MYFYTTTFFVTLEKTLTKAKRGNTTKENDKLQYINLQKEIQRNIYENYGIAK